MPRELDNALASRVRGGSSIVLPVDRWGCL